MATSCSSPKYLSRMPEIGTNQYGSYIKLRHSDSKTTLNGELIEVSNSRIVILDESSMRCIAVPRNTVKGFILQYAEPVNYWWTVPVSALFSLSHGIGMFLSFPVNMIATVSLASSSQHSVRYTHKHIGMSDLKMFARFPQGIPEGVTLGMIR